MNEKEFGRKIRVELDAGLDRLDNKVLERLAHARQAALAAAARPAERRAGSLAVVGGWLSRPDAGPMRNLASGLALMLCLAGAYMWFTADNADDDIDAVLLADELPLEAYVDHRFDKWLNR